MYWCVCLNEVAIFAYVMCFDGAIILCLRPKHTHSGIECRREKSREFIFIKKKITKINRKLEAKESTIRIINFRIYELCVNVVMVQHR